MLLMILVAARVFDALVLPEAALIRATQSGGVPKRR
jgi:hypothetical protein